MKNKRLTHITRNGQQILARWLLLACLGAGVPAAAAADAGVLRDLLTPALAADDTGTANTPLTAGELAAFYAARDYRPLWSAPAAQRALQAALEDLVHDGLDPGHYLPRVSALAADSPCGELMLTAAWLQAQLHLRFGALDRATIEPLWRLRPDTLAEPRQALLADAGAFATDPAAALQAARPDLPVYHSLRRALSDLLAEAEAEPWPQVPAGALLRPGQHDARIPALRNRLAAEAYVHPAEVMADPFSYDPALVQAVRDFQYRHQLAVDGIVGPATLAALNQSRQQRIAQLQANLERWRWLFHELWPHQILVDIAAARIHYDRDGARRWSARTTVGRALRQTPSLRSAVSHFTLNPPWTVPPTILKQDMLPAIRADRGYLREQHLQVLDAQGKALDPASVDWDYPGGIMLRQQPGPHSALGQVAIRFPNPFSVYLHDTPSKQLFARARRTDSSGCVRVEDVLTLVEELLRSSGQFDPTAVAATLASGVTLDLPLLAPVPLLLDYWTADLDDSGVLVLRPDSYARDEALAAMLSRAPAVPPPLPTACPAP